MVDDQYTPTHRYWGLVAISYPTFKEISVAGPAEIDILQEVGKLSDVKT